MHITDPVADMLTRIRNANNAKHETVDVPASNMKKSIAQIQLAYAAIIRAQKIAYVKDAEDKTIEKIEDRSGAESWGEKWEVQQAWDKQANFMKAQARAQSELRGLIKQYDEMLHKDWDAATEEQKARLHLLKAKLNDGSDDAGKVVIINDTHDPHQ